MLDPTARNQESEEPNLDQPADTTPAIDHLVDNELIDDELLVEEISIDGMCGVY